MLKIKVSGSPKRKMMAGLIQFRREVVYRAAIEAQNKLKQNLEGRILRVRSGALLQAWSAGPVVRDDGVRAVAAIIPSRKLPYLRIHEYGGTIKPRPENKSGYLRFRTPDGKWHMVREVVIPARAYVSVSVAQARPAMKRVAQQVLKDMAGKYTPRGFGA